jgi:hypothetical protein
VFGFEFALAGHREMPQALAGGGDIEAACKSAEEHVLLEITDDGLRGFAVFGAEFAQAVAQVFEIRIRQIVDVGRLGIALTTRGVTGQNSW